MRTSGLMRPSKLRLPESTDTAQAVLVGRPRDRRRQRARVADAGGAAEPDEVEAQLREVAAAAPPGRGSR